MKVITFIIVFLMAFLSFFTNAQATLKMTKKTNDTKITQAQKILKKYAQATAFKTAVQKTDAKKTLGTSQESKGTLYFSKNKFNLELASDRKTEIIYNGTKIWLIEYPDADFDPSGRRKVTVLSSEQSILARQFLNLFSDPKKLFTEFKVLDVTTSDDKKTTIAFKSNQKSIKKFQVEFDDAKSLVRQVQFTDDVDTSTTLVFADTKFIKDTPKDIFKYKPLKTDEVANQ